ncbi:MAG: leucyl aminopeptidase [Actinomycetota bacterium]|nr:leucyl aminopeptidase [Actinomycetota bacterium]
MPALTVSSANHSTTRADALILGIRNDDDAGEFATQLALLNFTGEDGQVAVFPSGGAAKAPLIVAVGLPETPTGEDLRRAAARGVKAAKGSATLAVALHPAGVDEVAAIAEGIDLGTYAFDRYKTKKKGAKEPKTVKSAVVLTAFARKTTTGKAIDRATTIAAAVNQTRDWVNSPPADLRPPEFARQISEYVPESVKATVWDEKRLAKEKCGGILGVGQGSDAPPRLVKLTYTPEGATKHLALVGKGITFDSGGLSIKPGASMQTMKLDMAGAAAIVAATVAIAQLGLPIQVTAFACLAENMPSGSATRPGDVLTMRDGQTVEVHNTDAEGRLVLADGLALAAEAKPDLIVDVATLTGACMVALGLRTSGILTNDDELAEQVFAASRTAGESMWPLPITEEMKALVKSSSLADIRQHNPKPYGGTLFAAAFLREFVGDLPWAHLDIAGPSFNEGSAYDYTPVGGTGAGVRTLVQLATELAEG